MIIDIYSGLQFEIAYWTMNANELIYPVFYIKNRNLIHINMFWIDTLIVSENKPDCPTQTGWILSIPLMELLDLWHLLFACRY